MRIAIEAQRIFRKNKHGMDFVAPECIRELQKMDTNNEYYIFVSPGEDHCLKESANMRIIEVKCPTYPLWEQVALPRALIKVKPDLLHCTSNTAPIHCPVPLILTLHDIIFLEPRQSGNKSWYQNMGWYYRRMVVPRILPLCKKVITVSRFAPLWLITRKYIQTDNYLFFLGNTDPKKNVPRTLKAYSIYLRRSHIKRPLLIADLSEERLDETLKEQAIEEIKPYLSYPGYIPNTDLAYLYNGAFAFLYTSLRESFGIPMLEAMACGTPVIAGNTSAMPEIAGDSGILVDPLEEEEIANALLRLEEEANYYDRQVASGLERVKEFSWEKTAKALLQLYETF